MQRDFETKKFVLYHSTTVFTVILPQSFSPFAQLEKMGACVLWFRHGLRLHDNPALLEAVQHKGPFFPVFILDGESAGTSLIGYNRMKFLLESLQDLDNQLRKLGSRLHIFQGPPTQIFYRFWQEFGLARLCFEQDCEAVWRNRDDTVKAFCKQYSIECIEKVSHTLWNPFQVIQLNGGSPPLTYEMFLHTVSLIGEPSRPVPNADWSTVNFGRIPIEFGKELNLFDNIPSPQDLGIIPENPDLEIINQWIGGETHALKILQKRLSVEEKAFRNGYYLPNHVNPDLLGSPTSQSAALRFGCLSVRKFYWNIHDLYSDIYGKYLPSAPHITGQLIWREYFYTMSIKNKYFSEMERNPICLNIPWYTSDESREQLQSWKEGKTGFPFIDAVMRQLILEGWVHHVARNAVACFLTRGNLWISWEDGLQHFLKYLLDADWSVCAGNWMWVSSSAFEQLLDCSDCICPVNFGRRLDPSGEYIKRYIPELRNLPMEYLYEPWCAPLQVQQKAKCIIGKDYPNRIVDHKSTANHNKKKMHKLRECLKEPVAHCCPSNEEEIRQFMWLSDACTTHRISV